MTAADRLMDVVPVGVQVVAPPGDAKPDRGAGLLLEAKGLNAWYGAAHILFDVDLQVNRGEVVALMGRNGAGKSTTLKALMGLLDRRTGSVTAMNDQHTFVRFDPGTDPLAVGDVLRLGISHPCTAFDKWRLIPVLDDAGAGQPVLVDFVRTVFG